MEKTDLYSILYTVIIGSSIGWIMGLCESPVVSIVFSTIITLGFAAIMILSGFKLSNLQAGDSKIEIEKSVKSATLKYISFFCLFLTISGTIALQLRKKGHFIAEFQLQQDTTLTKNALKEILFRSTITQSIETLQNQSKTIEEYLLSNDTVAEDKFTGIIPSLKFIYNDPTLDKETKIYLFKKISS